MAGFVEPGQPLDVEMEEIARLLPLVAPDQRHGREGCDLTGPLADQLGGDGRAGEAEPGRDLGRGEPAVAQTEDQLPQPSPMCAVASRSRNLKNLLG